MKYDLDAAAAEINRRGAFLSEKKRQRRSVGRISAACAAVFLLLLGAMYHFAVFGPAKLKGSVYGSFLLSTEAGGYVLVGVICFAAAVVITLLCVKHRGRSSNTDEKNLQPEGSDQMNTSETDKS